MVELVNAQTFSPDQIGQSLGPAIQTTVTWLYILAIVMTIMGGLFYFFWLRTFNIRVTVYELTRSNRVITYYTKAKVHRDKNLAHPILKFIGVFGFKGDTVNQPPAECAYPLRSSMGIKKMYHFVKSDGIYYPVSNTVLGKRYEKDGKSYYSIEGSGLEVSRDFESEKGTLNNLVLAGDKYRNRKPIEIAAMYGLMIIIVAGSFIVLGYAFYQTGQIQNAIFAVADAAKEVGNTMATQNVGPG